MALNNYNDLKNAVLNWMARTNDAETIAALSDLIHIAETRIYYGAGEAPLFSPPFRCRYNEKLADIAINAQSVTLPEDYLALRRFYQDSSPYDLQYLQVDDFWNKAASPRTGTPRYYTIEGENISFYPAPDKTYNGKLNYYSMPSRLSDTNITNPIFMRFPNLYLYAALLEAAIYVDDSNAVQNWHGLYLGAITGIQRQDERDRFGASPLIMRRA